MFTSVRDSLWFVGSVIVGDQILRGAVAVGKKFPLQWKICVATGHFREWASPSKPAPIGAKVALSRYNRRLSWPKRAENPTKPPK
jgi:hypothetical protein